jgi:hypothetical protein
MAIDTDQALEKAIAAPKSVTTQAGTVVSKSADEVIALVDRARKPKRPPLAVTRAILPGAIGPRTGSDTTE